MEKLNIVKIYRNSTDKQGNELKTADGRKYTKVALKTKEYPGEYVRGFGSPKNSAWKDGDEVEVIVERNGDFLNFSLPKETDTLEGRVAKLEKDMVAILSFVMEGKNGKLEKIIEPVDSPF